MVSMAAASAKLANRILFGLVVGLVAGVITLALGAKYPGLLAKAQWVSREIFDPAGQVFLRLLFFVIIPLVFASLAAGVVQLGRLDKLGPLAGKTFGLFGLNMIIGVALGLVMMDVVQPGRAIGAETREELRVAYASDAAKHIATNEKQEAMDFGAVVEMFMPRNLLGAITGQNRASIGEVLPLILFALLVGAVGVGLVEKKRQQLLGGLELVAELMTGIVHYALLLAPYLQRGRQNRRGDPVCARVVRAWNAGGDGAASVRDDVAVVEVFCEAFAAGVFQDREAGLDHGVFDEFECGDDGGFAGGV